MDEIHELVGRYDVVDENRFFRLLISNQNKITFQIYDGNGGLKTANGATEIDSMDWNYVCGVFEGDNQSVSGGPKVYLNGVLDGSAGGIQINSTAWKDDEDVFIGAIDDSGIINEANGTFDKVMGVNRDLTGPEIVSLYREFDVHEAWIKVPEIPASQNTTIYMYYGNLQANTTMNISNTFLFGDEFDYAIDSDRWVNNGCDYINGLEGYVNCTGKGSVTDTFRSTINFTSNVTMIGHFDLETPAVSGGNQIFGFKNIEDTNRLYLNRTYINELSTNLTTETLGSTTSVEGNSQDNHTYEIFLNWRDGNSSYSLAQSILEQGSSIHNHSFIYTSTDIPSGSEEMGIYLSTTGIGSNNASSINLDWIGIIDGSPLTRPTVRVVTDFDISDTLSVSNITANSPIQDQIFAVKDVTFNCSWETAEHITQDNMTLFIDGVNEFEFDIPSSDNYTELIYSVNLSNAYYNYSCIAYDDNATEYETATISFSVFEKPKVWWNVVWTNKKEIEINRTEGLEDYTENYTTFIDITYDSDMMSNFDDIRFVGANETIELSYWINESVSETSATAWVRVPYSHTSIYMYYGNENALNVSNENTTLYLYDDFDYTVDNSIWPGGAGITTTVEGGKMRMYTGTGGQDSSRKTAINITRPYSKYEIEVTNNRSAGNVTILHFEDGLGTIKDDGYTGDALNKIKAYVNNTGSFEIDGSNNFNFTNVSIITRLTDMDYSDSDGITDLNRPLQLYNRYGNDWNAPFMIAVYGNIGAPQEGVEVLIDNFKAYPFIENTQTSLLGEQEIPLEIIKTSPIDYANISITDVDFNCSVSTINSNADNLTLIIDGVDNETVDGNGNITLEKTVKLTEGTHNWSCRSASLNGYNIESVVSEFTIDAITETVIAPTTSVEGTAYSITLTIDSYDEINNIDANITYNNVINEMEISLASSNSYTFIYNSSALQVDTATNFTYNFTYAVNGIRSDIGNATHEVLNFTEVQISSDCENAAYTFIFKDEENQTVQAMNVRYNLIYGVAANKTLKALSGALTNVFNASICIDPTVDYIIDYGEIEYVNDNYETRRFYIFENQVLDTDTKNITLYSLLTSSATAFQTLYQDHTLQPYTNHYATILRWYPDENEYKIVEMGKLDDNGQTVMQVKTEDVDYRLALYKRVGDLVKLAAPIRMVCQQLPCTYTFNVESELIDLIGAINVNHELTFNRTISTFTFTYNDPNQDTSEMTLLVTQQTGTNQIVVCNNTAIGFTGVINCDATGYNGILKAVAYRSASPFRALASLVVDVTSSVFAGTMGLFIAFLLLLFIPLAGIIDPKLTVIFAVLALIPAFALGTLSYSIMLSIAVMAGIIIHITSRANR